jgi:hypothetical protein
MTEDEHLNHRDSSAFNSTVPDSIKIGTMPILTSYTIFSLPAHPLLGPFNGKPSILDPSEVKRPSELFFPTLHPERSRKVQQGPLPPSIPSNLDARDGITGMTEHQESAFPSQSRGDDAGNMSTQSRSDLLGY